MSVQPEFDSVAEADEAYYGASSGTDDGSGTDGGSDGGAEWGELQTEPTDWVAGWTLAYQPHRTDSGRRRWFVFRVNPETDDFEALTMRGQARTFPEDATLDELPHTEQEQEARDAYAAWVEENGADEEQQESTEWGEWTQLNKVAGWTIWGREAENSDRVQFLAAGKLQDGSTVYLQPDGIEGSEPHIYGDRSALQEALNAWQSRVQSGDVPESERPTGNSPGRGQVREDARAAGADRRSGKGQIPGPLAGAVDAVGGRRNAMIVAVVGGLVLLYMAEEYGYVDVGLQDTVAQISGGVLDG